MRINYQKPRCAPDAMIRGRRWGFRGAIMRRIGMCLMALGLFILVVALPVQFWFALLGLLLLAIGFLLWFLA